jgi:DNA-binding NarL/FixJ family response regulator
MRVAALVDDLLDRSRLTAALPDTTFVRDPAALPDVDVVIVDLVGHGDALESLRAAQPQVRIVAFGPHVDADALAAAGAAGADIVLPRSRFFRDPRAAVAPSP